jgi:hypothetical protein
MRKSRFGLTALALFAAACSDSNNPIAVTPAADAMPSFSVANPTWGVVSNVSPSYALLKGDSVQLRPVGYDTTGRQLQMQYTRYASSNSAVATVSSTGLVRAVAAGTASVTLTKEGVLPFTTVITVSVPVVAAPTTAPTTSTPLSTAPAPSAGEPAGFTMLTDRPFSAKALNQYDRANSEGWDPIEGRYPNFSLVSDPTAPFSGGSVGQMKYPAGFVGGSAPATAQKYFYNTNYKQLYVRVWVKLSANFQGQVSSTNKMFHLWIANGNRFFLSAEGAGSGPLYAQMRMQGVPDLRRRLVPNVVVGAQVRRGVWQQWELVVQTNTPGQANGEARWYIDGKLVSDYRNLEIVRVGEPENWQQVQWSPTWGGGGDLVQQDMFLWFDHMYVSGK